MKNFSVPIFSFGASLILAGFLLLHAPLGNPVMMFGVVFMATSVFYVAMSWSLFRIELSATIVLGILAAAMLLRLSFVASYPIGSEDAYRYIWDGKVQANGINPYLYSAVDERVAFLRSPLLPAAMNHADLKTIYFPLSEWIFYACYRLGGETLWCYKVLYVLAEAATMIGLSLMLAFRKVPQKFLLLYALCPLPIIEFAVDGHLDALGIPLFVFALFFYLKERKLLAYVLLGLSISIKPVGLVVLPALLLFESSWRRKTAAVIVPLLTVVSQFVPYVFASNPFEMLFDFTKNWSFNGIVFETLNLYFHNNQPSRIWCGVLLAVVLGFLLLKRRNYTGAIYFSLLSLILFSPVVHPWYIAWIAVVLPLARRWSGILLAAGASLTSFTVMHYRLTGAWVQYPAVLVLEYVPVIVAAIVEVRAYLAGKNEGLLA